MIRLCYKEYDWKVSQGANKSFTDKTGKDLYGVFASYITASLNLPKDVSIFERTEIFRGLHLEKTACLALHCIISEGQEGVTLDEISDGVSRVSWQLSEKPAGLSDPWPHVMLSAAFEINKYHNDNIPKKKADISEE